MPNDDFANEVLRIAEKASKEPFAPVAYYNRDGDCIEFFAEAGDFYAERVDEILTVYLSEDDNRLIGSLIKNVSLLCKKISRQIPGFAVDVRDGKVRLSHLFIGRYWCESPGKVSPVVVRTYQRLADKTNDIIVDAEEAMMA